MVKRSPLLIILLNFISPLLNAQNLIQNPSNEMPLVGGNIALWTEIQGTEWQQRDNGPLTQHGSQYLYV